MAGNDNVDNFQTRNVLGEALLPLSLDTHSIKRNLISNGVDADEVDQFIQPIHTHYGTRAVETFLKDPLSQEETDRLLTGNQGTFQAMDDILDRNEGLINSYAARNGYSIDGDISTVLDTAMGSQVAPLMFGSDSDDVSETFEKMIHLERQSGSSMEEILRDAGVSKDDVDGFAVLQQEATDSMIAPQLRDMHRTMNEDIAHQLQVKYGDLTQAPVASAATPEERAGKLGPAGTFDPVVVPPAGGVSEATSADRTFSTLHLDYLVAQHLTANPTDNFNTNHWAVQRSLDSNGIEARTVNDIVDPIRREYYEEMRTALSALPADVSEGAQVAATSDIIDRMDYAVVYRLRSGIDDDPNVNGYGGLIRSDSVSPDEVPSVARPASLDPAPAPSTTPAPVTTQPIQSTAAAATAAPRGDDNIRDMQEVMILPAVVEQTGIDGHTVGNSRTGEADGIRGSGTNSAFEALSEAAGGQPVGEYLASINVSAADVEKFESARADYIAAGNADPIVPYVNPNAVADVQDAMRINDEQIGLSLNGVDVNTGSAGSRNVADNDLGPRTARAIQATVAMAVASQAPEGADASHALTEQNIAYVEAYLTEQGVEDAATFASNLTVIANDPALSARYDNNVDPEIETAVLVARGSEEAEVASVAEEADAETARVTGFGTDAAAAAEAAGVVPASLTAGDVALAGDFAFTTNGHLNVARMDAGQVDALRQGIVELSSGDELEDLDEAAIQAYNAIPAVAERAELVAQRDTLIDTQIEETSFDSNQEALREGYDAVDTAEAALKAFDQDLRERDLGETYTYTYTTGTGTGFRGDTIQEHEVSFSGSLADFEERFGSGTFQVRERGENELRAQVEADFEALKASPEIAADRAELVAAVTEARGSYMDYVGDNAARGEQIAELGEQIDALDEQIAGTEITFLVPEDVDIDTVTTLVTDAGGTLECVADPEAQPVPGTPVTPKDTPDVLADNPAAGGEGIQSAEDTTSPDAGVIDGMALNTQANIPGMSRMS